MIEKARLVDMLGGVVLGGLERALRGVICVDADAVGADGPRAFQRGHLPLQSANSGGGQPGGAQSVGGGSDVAGAEGHHEAAVGLTQLVDAPGVGGGGVDDAE